MRGVQAWQRCEVQQIFGEVGLGLWARAGREEHKIGVWKAGMTEMEERIWLSPSQIPENL